VKKRRRADSSPEVAAAERSEADRLLEPLIVVTVSHYRIDRTKACGRTGKQLQQSLSDHVQLLDQRAASGTDYLREQFLKAADELRDRTDADSTA